MTYYFTLVLILLLFRCHGNTCYDGFLHAIMRVSNMLCDKMKFLLISIICQEKNPKSPYIMVAMVTIQNIVNFKMTTYLGLHA